MKKRLLIGINSIFLTLVSLLAFGMYQVPTGSHEPEIISYETTSVCYSIGLGGDKKTLYAHASEEISDNKNKETYVFIDLATEKKTFHSSIIEKISVNSDKPTPLFTPQLDLCELISPDPNEINFLDFLLETFLALHANGKPKKLAKIFKEIEPERIDLMKKKFNKTSIQELFKLRNEGKLLFKSTLLSQPTNPAQITLSNMCRTLAKALRNGAQTPSQLLLTEVRSL